MFVVALSVMAGVQPCIFPTTAVADAAIPEQALELFFQLGLPDTRRAKWVFAYGDGIPYETILGEDDGISGNAWLIHEDHDGTVELALANGDRVFGQRRSHVNPHFDQREAPLPLVDIGDADLEADLDWLRETLELPLSNSSEDEDSDDDSESSYLREKHGKVLLLLAHLQRQERTYSVQLLLPRLLARDKSPSAILDAAVSMLADSRLAQCTRDWAKYGDRATYARSLERLTNEFPRGWKNRDAVSLLLEKFKGQPPMAAEVPADVQKIADLLLNATPEQIRSLPREKYWLFGSTDSILKASESKQLDNSSGSPLAEFLNRKMEAACILAQLLNDHRYLRLSREEAIRPISPSYDEEEPSDILEYAYRFPRPYELHELAWELIKPLLSEKTRSFAEKKPNESISIVSAELERLRRFNDEELAWYYLREEGKYGDEFHSPFAYLVRHGGKETQEKLQGFFLDPDNWRGDAINSIGCFLKPFLRRMNSEENRTDFSEKLKSVAKKAITESRSNMMQGDAREDLDSELARQFRKLDLLLSSRPFSELAEEYANAASRTEAYYLSEVMSIESDALPWTEIEPALYRAAAKAKEAAPKQSMLYFAQRRYEREVQDNQGVCNILPVSSFDSSTRESLAQLLKDESLFRSATDAGSPSVRNIADYTASVFVWPRLTREEGGKWIRLLETRPQVGANALRSYALALAENKPLPSFPDAAKITEAEVQAIMVELSALAPEELTHRLNAKTLDQQLAIALHLERVDQWPDSFRAAHLTITSVDSTEKLPGAFSPGKWKGKQLNEATCRAIAEAVEEAAREGVTLRVAAKVDVPLKGAALMFSMSGQIDPPDRLPDILPDVHDKPTPAGVIYHELRSNSSRRKANLTIYTSPVWKDPVLTQEWRKKHLTSPENDPSDWPSREIKLTGYTWSRDLRELENRLKEVLSLRRGTRTPFSFQLHSSTIGEPDVQEGTVPGGNFIN